MVYEYLLIISPDNQTSSSLAQIKKIYCDRYGCINAANLKPHITLVNFIQSQLTEDIIIHKLKGLGKTYKPFIIELNGFGSFKTHTVFVNVLNKINITTIVKDIRAKFSKLLFFDKKFKPIFVTTPHITIARGMTEDQHNHAIREWQNNQFSKSFEANSMILLKRKPNAVYIKVATMPFTGEHLPGEQLTLSFK